MFRRILKRPFAVAGALLGVAVVVAALLAPWLAVHSPYEVHIEERLAGPSVEHPFGTDESGRDVFSRVLFGARTSLMVAVAVVLLASVGGAVAGGLAAFLGGAADEALQRLVDMLMAFPGILLVIALSSVLGPGVHYTVFALAATGWVGFARLMRAQVLRLKTLDFCEAARALGASRKRILFLHIFPSALAPILVQASLAMAAVIMAESSLSFLGLGVAPPEPSWGGMLASARDHMVGSPHLMVFPTLAIMLSVSAFYALGEGLREALDPKGELAHRA